MTSSAALAPSNWVLTAALEGLQPVELLYDGPPETPVEMVHPFPGLTGGDPHAEPVSLDEGTRPAAFAVEDLELSKQSLERLYGGRPLEAIAGHE